MAENDKSCQRRQASGIKRQEMGCIGRQAEVRKFKALIKKEKNPLPDTRRPKLDAPGRICNRPGGAVWQDKTSG